MKKLIRALGTLVLGLAVAASPSSADNSPASLFFSAVAQAAKGIPSAGAVTKVPAAGEVEIAFSPDGGAEQLVLKTINAAQAEIRLMAYSFTSAPVVSALLAAKRRGVDVKVVVDHKHNVQQASSGKPRAAMGALANAGVDVRTVDVFAIAHDKVVIADGKHVQTGSFNYSAAAAKSNSENVVVLWNNPQAAKTFLTHWGRNWRAGRDWHPLY